MSDLSNVRPDTKARSGWARLRSFVAWGVVLTVISVAGCGGIPVWPNTVAESDLQDARTVPVASAEVDLGPELYATNCAGCHGRGADDLRGIASMSEGEVFSYISVGDQERGMPAYGNTLSEAEIEALVVHLRVLTGSETTSVSASASSVLWLEADVSDDPGTVTLVAVLTDQAGSPIGEATIDFVARTFFGDLALGSAATDVEGKATLAYELTGANLDSWAASYAGDSQYGSSSAEVQTETAPIEPPSSLSGSLIGSRPPLLPTLIVVAVVASVWIVFGYAIYQLITIRWESAPDNDLSPQRGPK